jgi:hypothetical protein
MADSDAVRAALAELREARPRDPGALGGYGLAEAYDALVTAWTRHLDVVSDVVSATQPAPERDG